MGLGSAQDVGLAKARDAAAAARQVLLERRDPLDEKHALQAQQKGERLVTFRHAAETYIAANRAGWRNPKHAGQWETTLDQHVFAKIGHRPVAQVETTDVMKVIEPIWTVIPETAGRVRGRIELVLDYAAARGWRAGDNPARWRGHIAHMLPRRSKVARVVHHSALPYKDMPAVMAKLMQSTGTGALAVRFATLTAARSGEVRGATWSEVDVKEKVWTVPGERMKAGREHRVPLSEAALVVLHQAQALGEATETPYVFPGGRSSRPLSDVGLSKALHTAASDQVTVHGLRSTFRDWVAEATEYPRDVAEMALAHAIGDKVEAAYRRGDLFEKRRALMEEWARLCSPPVVR